MFVSPLKILHVFCLFFFFPPPRYTVTRYGPPGLFFRIFFSPGKSHGGQLFLENSPWKIRSQNGQNMMIPPFNLSKIRCKIIKTSTSYTNTSNLGQRVLPGVWNFSKIVAKTDSTDPSLSYWTDGLVVHPWQQIKCTHFLYILLMEEIRRTSWGW